MVGIITYWDIHPDLVAVIGGSKRWLSTYIFTMEAFGADTLYIIGKPNIQHGYNIQHTEYETLDEILHLYSDAEIVALVGSVPEGTEVTNLEDYIHPTEDVLYIIGGDYSDINFEVCNEHNVKYVHIDNLINSSVLWSNTVVGITLRDRYLKSL